MGRGPKHVHAHLIGDLLVVRLRGVLTAAERQLVKALPADDPQVGRPDITRARELLGWEPEVDLEEGLRRTIAYWPPCWIALYS